MILAAYQIITGCIIGLSILPMVYLAITNPATRLSSILMAMGVASLAFDVFSPPGIFRTAVGLLGLVPFLASLILSLRSVYTTSPGRQA